MSGRLYESPLSADRCSETYFKVVKTGIEDALTQLDRLTQDEVRMAAAQGLKAAHALHDKVQGVENKVQQVTDDLGDHSRSSSNSLI